MHDRDRRARQRDPWVQRLDLGVIPGLDVAHEDVAERLAIKLEARLHAGQVVADRDRAKEHGDLHWRAAVLCDRGFVFGLQRRIACAEVDRLVLQRREAGSRADGLIVDGQTG